MLLLFAFYGIPGLKFFQFVKKSNIRIMAAFVYKAVIYRFHNVTALFAGVRAG